MDMSYEEMMRAAEAFYADQAHAPSPHRLTRHEEMLRRLSGENKDLYSDAMLSVLCRMFTAEEAEVWLLYPSTAERGPKKPGDLAAASRPELRPRLGEITKKLVERQVLVPAECSEGGYFACCGGCCMERLCAAAQRRAARPVKGRRNARPAAAAPEKPAVEAPVKVTAEKCVGCKLCMRVCAQRAIRVLGKHVLIDGGVCAACGTCTEKCPKKALRLGA